MCSKAYNARWGVFADTDSCTPQTRRYYDCSLSLREGFTWQILVFYIILRNGSGAFFLTLLSRRCRSQELSLLQLFHVYEVDLQMRSDSIKPIHRLPVRAIRSEKVILCCVTKKQYKVAVFKVLTSPLSLKENDVTKALMFFLSFCLEICLTT